MKIIKLTLNLVFLFSMTFLSAQTTEQRAVDNFKSISVQSGIDLHITQEDGQSVEIKAKSDIINHVITSVEGNTLKIYLDKKNWKWNNWKNNGPIDAYVSVAYLDRLTASGGSDVDSKGIWKSEDFELIASGGSDISMSVDVKFLEIECSGGSDIDLDGSTHKLELISSGGSDFNGRKLIAKEANIKSSGGSDAHIHVTDKLVARASGASDIHYSGDPKIRDIDSSSSSDVEKY